MTRTLSVDEPAGPLTVSWKPSVDSSAGAVNVATCWSAPVNVTAGPEVCVQA
ncbi:MAG TPA: hypothetical protein VGG05_00385 [Pseudonocardiaceae bacterium]